MGAVLRMRCHPHASPSPCPCPLTLPTALLPSYLCMSTLSATLVSSVPLLCRDPKSLSPQSCPHPLNTSSLATHCP